MDGGDLERVPQPPANIALEKISTLFAALLYQVLQGAFVGGLEKTTINASDVGLRTQPVILGTPRIPQISPRYSSSLKTGWSMYLKGRSVVVEPG